MNYKYSLITLVTLALVAMFVLKILNNNNTVKQSADTTIEQLIKQYPRKIK